MLGRQVGSTLLRLPIYARLVLRPSPFQCQHDLTSRVLIFSSQRSYATPGRPKKAVGEPSRPVKRAVKRAAKSTTGGQAQKQVQEKKKNARAKKTTAKKAAPKKPKRKQLTEEQKAAQKAGLTRAKIADLKKAALLPPESGKHVTANNMFVKEKSKGQKIEGKAAFGQTLKDIAQQFKELSPAEVEHYNHLAQQEKEARQARYKRWVESHTPEQIQLANRARQQLKRKLDLKGRQKYSLIKDERAVKRPVSSFIQFSVNRQASGDFKNIPLKDRARLIGQEWRALNESEKKKYKDLQSEDRSRFANEYNHVFGHYPPKEQAAAAAA